jgi:hypothetical protein
MVHFGSSSGGQGAQAVDDVAQAGLKAVELPGGQAGEQVAGQFAVPVGQGR